MYFAFVDSSSYIVLLWVNEPTQISKYCHCHHDCPQETTSFQTMYLPFVHSSSCIAMMWVNKPTHMGKYCHYHHNCPQEQRHFKPCTFLFPFVIIYYIDLGK